MKWFGNELLWFLLIPFLPIVLPLLVIAIPLIVIFGMFDNTNKKNYYNKNKNKYHL